jgi:curli biogenesis system outer membrane secretion channel CsgG
MARKWTGACSPFLSLVRRVIAQRVIAALAAAMAAVLVEVVEVSAAATTAEASAAATKNSALQKGKDPARGVFSFCVRCSIRSFRRR